MVPTVASYDAKMSSPQVAIRLIGQNIKKMSRKFR